MSRKLSTTNGFTVFETLVVIIVAVVVVVAGLFIIHETKKPNLKVSSSSTSPTAPASKPSKSTTPAVSLYATLAPATVPSKTAECSQAVTFSSNGDSGPVQCSNGYLNIAEWKSLEALEPQVMTLGYSATLPQVQAALCADVKANITNVIEVTSYQISALYYGWDFGSSPTAVITNGACVNQDD